MDYHTTSDQSMIDNNHLDYNQEEEKDVCDCITELINLRMELDDMRWCGEYFYRGNLIENELEDIESQLHYYGWYD